MILAEHGIPVRYRAVMLINSEVLPMLCGRMMVAGSAKETGGRGGVGRSVAQKDSARCGDNEHDGLGISGSINKLSWQWVLGDRLTVLLRGLSWEWKTDGLERFTARLTPSLFSARGTLFGP